MYIRICLALAFCFIAGRVSALTVNIDFATGFYGHIPSTYVSPAGVQTAGYWNTGRLGVDRLRDRTGTPSVVVGNFSIPRGGQSPFAGSDLTDPNRILGDTYAAQGGFQYSFSGLLDGQYDLFLYARLANETFSGGGVDLAPLSLTRLVGDIYTYAYSVDVSGGSLELASRGPVTWIAGLQITNDPEPMSVPLPGTAWLLLAGVSGLAAARRFSC